jgi:SNF2 family DNA or RNA helicase
MLAEIGKLRQAAVEPRLIDDKAPRGAKLQQVVQRTLALVEAGHKVLVFTQFLGVLAMLDGRFRLRGVRILELQGSTPAAERAKRVAAFQAGEADVFLMSLKAGGIGVNLTAADYVIHVDPWWNPAVEDQATARAHRMGQSKAVTVYHFCTEGSIEPKIFDLHERKRDLAEDILEGMAKNKRLDLDELRALMS